MRPGLKTLIGTTLVAPGLVYASLGWKASYGDEPSRLGRLFRFGGASAASTPAPGSSQPASSSASSPSAFATPLSGGAVFTGAAPSTANAGSSSSRLVPQPRVSRAATEADPIVTRIALTRSNDGNQFGMFLQVYADGTVIDSEGVHHVSPADLKPLTDTLQSGELYRLKGHCGSPPTDYVEQVYMVVYERSLGRLRATSFSHSGNPQGCDHSVRHLHAALDALQAKLSRSAAPISSRSGSLSPVPSAPQPANVGGGSSIPLTPIN